MGTRNAVLSPLLAIVFLLSAGSVVARGFIQSPELLDRIKIGVTTAQEVEQILGAPASRSDYPRVGLVSMNYTVAGDMGKNRVDVGVMIDKGGIVRDIQKTPQYGGG
jgi:outer membrane protein assembly factor BamE (lipoprotein component of BamABCDE complex)